MTDSEQRSARIYQFPIKHRAAVGGRRNEIDIAVSQGVPVVAGGAWYHDEAIQEAARANARSPRFPSR